MKLVAVLDSSIVVSGIGWRGEARNVLRLLARGGFVSIRTPYGVRCITPRAFIAAVLSKL